MTDQTTYHSKFARKRAPSGAFSVAVAFSTDGVPTVWQLLHSAIRKFNRDGVTAFDAGGCVPGLETLDLVRVCLCFSLARFFVYRRYTRSPAFFPQRPGWPGTEA